MQVFEKSKVAFERNMDKFKIYAMRNIFAPAAPSSSQSTASSSAALPPNTTDEQLAQLRSQYLALQAELRELTDSCRDTELLVKDMRSTLFTLRVGAQAFDDGDILPVAETVANIAQNREKLLRMVSEANGKSFVALALALCRCTWNFFLFCRLTICWSSLGILSSLDENKKASENAGEGTGTFFK